MRQALVAFAAVSSLLVAARPASAGADLVSFDDLQKRLETPHLRILDPRPRKDYDAGHLPGAVWVDSKAAQTLAARPGGLTDREAWEAWLAPLAISAGDEVLVCDGARQLDAARIWWLLGYLGVEKAGLIDGNVPLWKKQGRPLATTATTVEPRAFPVRFRADRHATRGEVLEAVKGGSIKIVDARSLDEYTGVKKSSKKGGHVPTACRLEWSELVDADGRFLDAKGLRAKLSALAVKPGEPLITHCQGGGRASVDAFALERLGHPARNYYLGWSDWGNADETPIVPGEKP